MIPDAAVAAAAKAMFAEEEYGSEDGPDIDDKWLNYASVRDREQYRRMARRALEAAAPYMLAKAFLRGLAVGYYVERGWTYAEALQMPIPEHLANPDEDSEEIPCPYRAQRG